MDDHNLIACGSCGATNRLPRQAGADGRKPVCGRCRSPLKGSQQGSSDPAPDGTEAPPIGPEFVSGTAEDGLEKIRTRLLDLTNRNRLLNFRHSAASMLRIVDTGLNSIFEYLAAGDKLAFMPVPDAPMRFEEDGSDGESPRKKPQPGEYAKTIGWPASHELDPEWEERVPKILPVLHYTQGLETLTRKISSAAKTAIEESGTNMLYMIFGFLEWYEAEDSQIPRLAPLLTLPVALERSSAKGKGFECTLEYSGDDFTTNLSLAEKLRRDFGLELPAVEDEDSPHSYFSRFGPLLDRNPRWRIRRQVTLSLLSFGKLLMYRDLDPSTWPEGNIANHPLVRDLFEGRKSTRVVHAPEYLIDDPALESVVPEVILDADSSQHSALIDALQGRNVVIEGPPGTGKSQTITNLIAAALVKGKTVLFVSEKLAALEVVRRRLDEVGLGLFCLELHSHKTQKHALLNDVTARLNARGGFKEPRDFDELRSVVERRKRALTQYVGLMNGVAGIFGATTFEVLWARDRHHQELPIPLRQGLNAVLLPGLKQFSRARYEEALKFLSVYGGHLAGIKGVAPNPDEHPWSWVGKGLNFDEEVKLLDLLGSLSNAFREAISLRHTLAETTGILPDDGIDGLLKASELGNALPQANDPALAMLLEPCRNPAVRSLLRDFAGKLEAIRECDSAVRAGIAAGDSAGFLSEASVTRLGQTLEAVQDLNLETADLAQLSDLLDRARAAAKVLRESAASYARVQQILGSKLDFNTEGVDVLAHCVRLIETAPFEVLYLRAPQMEAEGFRPRLREAAEEAAALSKQHSELDRRFNLALAREFAGASQLRDHADIINGAGFWQVWFTRSYRMAVKTHARISRDPSRVERSLMTGNLLTVHTYLLQRRAFDANQNLHAALAPHFRGVETQWNELQRLADWYEQILLTIPEDGHDLRNLLLKSRTERLRAVKAELAGITDLRKGLESIPLALASVSTIPRMTEPRSLNETGKALQSVEDDLEALISTLSHSGMRKELRLFEVRSLLVAAKNYREHAASVLNSSAIQILGASFAGCATDPRPIKEAVEFAHAVAGSGLPEKAQEFLLCSQYLANLSGFRDTLSRLHRVGEDLKSTCIDVRSLTDSAVWPLVEGESLTGALAKVNALQQGRELLTPWLHFVRMRLAARDQGVDRLTTLADRGALEPQDLIPAFRFVFHNTLSHALFAENPALSEFNGITQDLARTQFAEADRKAILLFRERAAAILDRRPVPSGNGTGPVRSWTNLALIMNETNKQMRHIPIRQLVRRAGAALQALKPCFLMGPLSVAQYLTPGEIRFDLVVMDEASQLKPEDAIGAIARGGQIVIVGDPKQLPPTNFFQTAFVDPDEEEDGESRTVAEEGESILDVASTLYQPVRRLRWHYRSRHHSLIAFSNREFYQGDLIVFPSAFHEDPSLGVKYQPVSDGVYDGGRNPREAAVIVEAVLQHMRMNPGESLGVVAMNLEQRDLIEELLDQKLHTEPFAIAFQNQMNMGAEPFFIKNLENVQGDERDVIFISVTYGPDPRGNQYMRFGPVNSASGHRRLNVLFTRAKRRIEVFSSVDPDRIQVNPNSTWGLRAFKHYLTFARTGVLDAADGAGGEAESDFELAVGAVLKEHGYTVDAQVGVAGFSIDLGIRHPAKPGAYVLGIECDGATYHSSRSARDRDRLRQEILENLGWKIHRVWSTDWFKSRNTEIKRLLERVEKLLAGDPDYLRERQNLQRLRTLRVRLTELRDQELHPAFQEVEPEKSLLRPELLDEFLRRRPRTREDWLRLIAPELRSETDPNQVGRFLPRVLEIVSETFGS